MSARALILMVLVGLLGVGSLLADTIVFKNGTTVEGTYVGGTTRAVRFRVDGVLKNYALADVDAIHFGDQEISPPVPRADVSDQRFRELDRNNDGFVSSWEWPGKASDFDTLDRNYDGRLSREESMAWAAGDWREDRFRVFDQNNDGYIRRTEWTGTETDFNALDKNRDGRLSRAEASVWTSSDWREARFREWDHNNDGMINKAEWHHSEREFTRLDRDRDGMLSRDEAGDLDAVVAAATDRSGRRQAVLHTEFVIPGGTVLRVRTNETIDSETARPGVDFSGTLEEDLVVRNDLVAQRGTPVTLRISEVEEAGEFRGRTTLTIDLVQMRVNGVDYALSTSQIQEQGRSQSKQTAAVVGGGAALGAIIGAIAGGGKGAAIGAAIGASAGGGYQILTKGDKVKIPAETVLEFTMQKDLYLRR